MGVLHRQTVNGVCNPNGQVFDTTGQTTVHPGLYVCDASLIPCSIGINPCLTIATAAEYVSRHPVKDALTYKAQTAVQLVDPPIEQKLNSNADESMVVIEETMRDILGGMPCMASLKMKMRSGNQKGIDEGNWVIGNSHPLIRGKVGGYVIFTAVEKDRLYITDAEVDLCEVDNRTPFTQYMHYRLPIIASSGSRNDS